MGCWLPSQRRISTVTFISHATPTYSHTDYPARQFGRAGMVPNISKKTPYAPSSRPVRDGLHKPLGRHKGLACRQGTAAQLKLHPWRPAPSAYPGGGSLFAFHGTSAANSRCSDEVKTDRTLEVSKSFSCDSVWPGRLLLPWWSLPHDVYTPFRELFQAAAFIPQLWRLDVYLADNQMANL